METSCKAFLNGRALFFLILLVCGTDHVKPEEFSYPPSEVDPEVDPVGIVGKALLCFDHPDSCTPEQRLTPSGCLNIPRNETDEYCNGGCYEQTKLVLSCVDEILSNFEFYNNATIDDINTTITEGCSNTDKRGDFNVTDYMDSTSHANRDLPGNVGSLAIFAALCGLLSMISQIMA